MRGLEVVKLIQKMCVHIDIGSLSENEPLNNVEELIFSIMDVCNNKWCSITSVTINGVENFKFPNFVSELAEIKTKEIENDRL